MSSNTKAESIVTGQDSNLVMLADRYRIRQDEPIPALNGPSGIRAFNVTDERGSPKALFALVCRNDIAARSDVLNQFSRFSRLPMTTPLRWGVVYWPPENARRLVIIMNQPGGERILPSADATMDPWREDRVVRTVMHPLMPLFKELGGRNLTHRAIRADNLFFANSTRESVVLGECFSLPPAMAQPSIYETIDSAMSMPEGRGYGSSADDFYALGVLILFLLCGGNPVPQMSEQKVIEAKISKGSYSAIVGTTRLSLPMVEVLRGLLCDDPEERWGHEDLLLWLNGRHLSPKQALLPPKAARLFPFDGVEFTNGPALSYAMGLHWHEALKLIKDNELERWVRRSLSDDARANIIRAATQAAGIGGGNSSSTLEDRLLSRVLIALDSQAPLRYKQIAVRILGFPTAFATNYNNAERRQSFAELIQHKLPQLWIDSQRKARNDHVGFARTLDLVGLHLTKPRIGYGIERTLYSLNPGWPCQSDLLKNDYVADLESLLPALERLAQQGKTSRGPIDWHIAGFISARMKSAPDRAFSEMAQEDNPTSYNVGVVRLLAEVQESVGPQRLPHLAAWCATLLKPVTTTYRNRERREQMAAAMQQVAAKGSLMTLLKLADNPNRRLLDDQGFRRAKAEYAALVEQMSWLRNGGLAKPAIVRTSAREASSITSSVIAAVAVLIITVSAVF